MKKKQELDIVDLGLKLGALAITIVGGIIGNMQTKRYLDRMIEEKLNPEEETED